MPLSSSSCGVLNVPPQRMTSSATRCKVDVSRARRAETRRRRTATSFLVGSCASTNSTALALTGPPAVCFDEKTMRVACAQVTTRRFSRSSIGVTVESSSVWVARAGRVGAGAQKAASADERVCVFGSIEAGA